MTEESCLFVSSRGIAKSCKYRNDVLISSESGVRFSVNEPIRFFALTKKVNAIYVCTSATQQFVEKILPTIVKKFVLITGDSDNTVPEGCAYSSVILSHPYLSAWFSQNCFGGHPKLHQIPIGHKGYCKHNAKPHSILPHQGWRQNDPHVHSRCR